MSDRLESFIESIVQEIKCNEEQRERIRSALRVRLETMVSAYVGRGFQPEAAEREAMRRLTPHSSALYKHLHGERAWQLFKCVSSALCITVLLLVMPNTPLTFDKNWWVLPVVFAVVMALVWFSGGRLAGRLLIDSGLCIRRWHRRNVTIPFDQMRTVRTQGLHLWGPVKVIYLEHEGGTAKVSAKLRGLHVGLITLEALSPGTLDAKLKERLDRQLVKARYELWQYKLIISLVWICGGAIVLNWLPMLWIGEVYPWWVMAALAAVALTAWWQYVRHTDPAREGMAALLATAAAGAMFAMIGGFIHGEIYLIQWPLIAALSAFAMALPVIWWRGPRWGLAVLAVFVMIGAGLSPRWSKSIFPQVMFVQDQTHVTYAYTADAFLEDFAVLGADEIVWLHDWNQAPPVLVYQHGDTITTHTLGTGSGITTLIPPPPDALISILRLGTKEEKYRPYIDSLLPGGGLRHEDWLTSPVQFQPSWGDKHPLWSPNGRWVRASDDGLAVAENGTGRVIYRAEGLKIGQHSAWIDNERLRAVDVVDPVHINLEEFGREPGLYVYEIDTAERTTELKHQFEYAPYTLFTGLEYCVIGGDRVNLTTGERLVLPGWEGPTQASDPAWHAPTRRLAYTTQRVKAEGDDDDDYTARELVVIDEIGEVIARRSFRLGQRILYLEFSPDGKKLSMIRIPHDAKLGMSWMLSNAFTEVWNLESGEIHVATQMGGIRAILMSIASSSTANQYKLPEWSPDSSALLHPYQSVDYGHAGSSAAVYNSVWKATLPIDGE